MAEIPTNGGSYTRNPDGSLTLVQRTLEPGETHETQAAEAKPEPAKSEKKKG